MISSNIKAQKKNNMALMIWKDIQSEKKIRKVWINEMKGERQI